MRYFNQVILCEQDIIRDSKVMKNEMEHQLYVYQSLIFRSLLVDFIFTKGNAQNQVSVSLLCCMLTNKPSQNEKQGITSVYKTAQCLFLSTIPVLNFRTTSGISATTQRQFVAVNTTK